MRITKRQCYSQLRRGAGANKKDLTKWGYVLEECDCGNEGCFGWRLRRLHKGKKK